MYKYKIFLGFSRATGGFGNGTRTPSLLLTAEVPVQPHRLLRSANTDFVTQCSDRVFMSMASQAPSPTLQSPSG